VGVKKRKTKRKIIPEQYGTTNIKGAHWCGKILEVLPSQTLRKRRKKRRWEILILRRVPAPYQTYHEGQDPPPTQ